MRTINRRVGLPLSKWRGYELDFFSALAACRVSKAKSHFKWSGLLPLGGDGRGVNLSVVLFFPSFYNFAHNKELDDFAFLFRKRLFMPKHKQSFKSFKRSAQRTELEYHLEHLESQKGLLEKSVSNTTVKKIVIPIAVFAITFCVVSGFVGFFYNFIGPTISETPWELTALVIASIIIAIPIAIVIYNNRKQNDIEAFEQTNDEIQEVKNQIQSMKK